MPKRGRKSIRNAFPVRRNWRLKTTEVVAGDLVGRAEEIAVDLVEAIAILEGQEVAVLEAEVAGEVAWEVE